MPSRKPPELPRDAKEWFQPRSNKPPTVPSRVPSQHTNVFEHVNGMSKVVAQSQMGCFVQNVCDQHSSNISNAHPPTAMSDSYSSQPRIASASTNYIRNYINQHEMVY